MERAAPPVLVPASTSPTYKCRVCQSTYSRISHLRRHEVIHAGQRTFGCHFCNRQFFRADVARRHSTTCPHRGNMPMPGPRQRGKKKQACDQCASAKRGCDQDHPCEGCLARDLICTYSRSDNHYPQQAHLIPSLLLPPDGVQMESPANNCELQVERPGDDIITRASDSKFPRVRVGFLLNYTSTTTTTSSLTDFFGSPSSSTVPTPQVFSPGGYSPPMLDDLEDLMQSSTESSLGEYLWAGISETQPLHLPDPRQAQLQPRLAELISQLKVVHASLPARTKSKAPIFAPELVEMLFTVGNLIEFTRLYFDNWHPNCPILHRSSFDPESASLPLLFVVFLIGATFSSPRDTASMAREYFDLAEEFAFENREFTSILEAERLASGSPPKNASIEALQSTLLVTVLQNWQNGTVSRRRMRTQRYTEIISASRLVNLFSTRNEHLTRYKSQSEAFNWKTYYEAEQRVRLMCYIFLVDCQYAIFYRYPTRVMISEMTGDLPSSEEAFSATDAVTCKNYIIDTEKRPQLSLSTCIQMLLLDVWELKYQNQLMVATTLGFFTMINALHSIIFMTTANCLGNDNFDRNRRAFSRWKMLWESHHDHMGPQRLKKIGFMKNSLEFWHLANIVRSETSQNVRKDKEIDFDADSMTEINSLLERFEGVRISE